MRVVLWRAKFKPCSARRTFLNSGLDGEGRVEICAFFNEKLAIDLYRKWWDIRPS